MRIQQVEVFTWHPQLVESKTLIRGRVFATARGRQTVPEIFYSPLSPLVSAAPLLRGCGRQPAYCYCLPVQQAIISGAKWGTFCTCSARFRAMPCTNQLTWISRCRGLRRIGTCVRLPGQLAGFLAAGRPAIHRLAQTSCVLHPGCDSLPLCRV